MNIRKLIDLRTAIAVTCALCLAAACGSSDGERKQPDKRKPNIPSIAKDTRAHAANNGKAMPVDAGVASVAEEPAAKAPPMPTTFRGLMKRGKSLARAGDTDEAIVMYGAAAKAKQNASAPRIELARAYLSKKHLRSARKHAELAVKLAPSSSYAWNTLGRVELAEGKRDAAIVSFERATEENEDNSYAWNNLGYTLMLDEQWDEAVIALERATSGASPKSYMWNNLGMAYEHHDRLDEARAAYRQAATGGSSRAQASLDRLRGVKSIKVVAKPDQDDAADTDATPATKSDDTVDPAAADPADKASDSDGDNEAEESVLGC